MKQPRGNWHKPVNLLMLLGVQRMTKEHNSECKAWSNIFLPEEQEKNKVNIC